MLATDDRSVRGRSPVSASVAGLPGDDDVLGTGPRLERTGKVEMTTSPSARSHRRARFERARKTRERLAALFAPAGQLSSESVEIREILDELGVRALIDAEIAAQRDRALHALRGSRDAAAREPLDLLERPSPPRRAPRRARGRDA